MSLSISYCLAFVTLGLCMSDHPNLLFRMHVQLAKAANRTNCWVCSIPPPSQSTSAMAAIYATYSFGLSREGGRDLTIELNGTFLDDRIGRGSLYNLNSDHNSCITLSRPIWVSGRLGDPQVCFNFSFGDNDLGTTTCKNGVTISLDNDILDFSGEFNGTEGPEYVCWHGFCGTQTRAEIPQLVRLIAQAEHRLIGGTCIGLSGPYYFLCGSSAYKVIPPGSMGTCTLVKLVPASYVTSEEDFYTHEKLKFHWKSKRELFTKADEAWAWFPAWTGWGIELMNRLNNFSSIVDQIFNETVEAVREISEEQRQMKLLLFQEKMALDYLLAAKGGFCEFIGRDCCTWIADTKDQVQAHLDKIKDLQGKARAIAEEGWNPFKGLSSFGDFIFSIGDWLKRVGVYILMLLFSLLIIYAFIRCSCCLLERVARDQATDHIMISRPIYYEDQDVVSQI